MPAEGSKSSSQQKDDKISETGASSKLSDIGPNVTILAGAVDQFSQLFAGEIATIHSQFRALQKDHRILLDKFSSLSKELATISEKLTSEKARGDTLQKNYDQALSTGSSVKKQLERALAELHETKEHLFATQNRYETVRDDQARILADYDAQRRDLEMTHQEIGVLQEQYQKTKLIVELSRQRESEVEARLQITLVDVENYRSQLGNAYTRIKAYSSKASEIETELSSTSTRLKSAETELEAVVAERDRLAAEKENLIARLHSETQKHDAKIDGLSKTKRYLAETLDIQRKQSSEQLSRIAQLEQSNANLSRLVQTSQKTGANELPMHDGASEDTKSADPKVIQMKS